MISLSSFLSRDPSLVDLLLANPNGQYQALGGPTGYPGQGADDVKGPRYGNGPM
jgi:hypothetical protein